MEKFKRTTTLYLFFFTYVVSVYYVSLYSLPHLTKFTTVIQKWILHIFKFFYIYFRKFMVTFSIACFCTINWVNVFSSLLFLFSTCKFSYYKWLAALSTQPYKLYLQLLRFPDLIIILLLLFYNCVRINAMHWSAHLNVLIYISFNCDLKSLPRAINTVFCPMNEAHNICLVV